ncbi:MAG: LptF/LptG family permease [Phycisphaerae bacterium]
MIRTLHGYIGRDLIKVMLQALIAFTLVMMVFVIFEPLRKQGLAGDQVLRLFVYTLPGLISLTLPIAALLAATFVYGRFSQDNELLACRASGIGTLSLLKPALGLGLAVTVLTLLLSSIVAPLLAQMGAAAAEQNIRRILFHKIKSEGHFKHSKWLLHAESVDEKRGMLYGVVGADMKPTGDARLLVASSAEVQFRKYGARTYVAVLLKDSVETSTAADNVIQLGEVRFESPPLPPFASEATEEVSSYSWKRLLAMRADPSEHPRITTGLKDVRQHILHNNAVTDVTETISAGKPYELTGSGEAYKVRAPAAEVVGYNEAKLLAGVDAQGNPRPVEVEVHRGGMLRQRITADSGTVTANWSVMSDASFLSLRLSGNVVVRFLGRAEDHVQRRDDWRVGKLRIPEPIIEEVGDISLQDIYNNPQRYTRQKDILKAVTYLTEVALNKIIAEIEAELHGRAAYGVSCFLMVAMGAALGLMFKGGQLISAFALAAIPGGTMLIMIIMGQQLMTNPDVPQGLGGLAIWGGVVLLAVADVVLYVRHMRQ